MARSTSPASSRAAGTPGHIDEVDLLPVRTYWNLVAARFRQNRLAVVGLIMLRDPGDLVDRLPDHRRAMPGG